MQQKQKQTRRNTGAVGELNGKALVFFKTTTNMFAVVFFLQLIGGWDWSISLMNDLLEYIGASRAFGGVMNTLLFGSVVVMQYMLGMVTKVEAND